MKTIYKKYVDEDTIQKTTLTEFIEHTEGSGYYKQGTARDLLSLGIVRTPFAVYSLIKEVLTSKN